MENAGSPNFRVIQDATPPRIALRFKLVDASGAVLAEGERILIDLDFVAKSLIYLVGPLRYEKALIDAWLASELRQLVRTRTGALSDLLGCGDEHIGR